MWKFQTSGFFIIVILFLTAGSIRGSYAENVLKLALNSDPTSIDPRFARDVNSARVHQIVTNGLFKKDQNLRIVPCLVDRWETHDGTTYIFF